MRTLAQISDDFFRLWMLEAAAQLLGAGMRNNPDWRVRIEAGRIEAEVSAMLANQMRRMKQHYGRSK